ncbi:hypothetical protein LTR85_004157 [Meristemomyces frigidus]|nr:hypothetical protein LTR85_004157 [Meristemomyces frigidus]
MTQTEQVEETRRESLELAALGYKQAMPRRFSLWSLAALAFDLTCTWLGVGSSLGISLTEASAAGTLWTIVVAGCMTMVIAAGMAELASAYPVAGAQNGWISIIGWWLGAASVANFISAMILEIVQVWYPEFEVQHWQQYLIYVGITWIAVGINVFASRWIPLFNKMIFVLAVLTLTGTMLALFTLCRNGYQYPRQS